MKTVQELRPTMEGISLYINRELREQQCDGAGFVLMVIGQNGLAIASNNTRLQKPEDIREMLDEACQMGGRDYTTVTEQ